MNPETSAPPEGSRRRENSPTGERTREVQDRYQTITDRSSSTAKVPESSAIEDPNLPTRDSMSLERIVLGMLLKDPEAYHRTAEGQLAPEDFMEPAAADLYRKIEETADPETGVDDVAVRIAVEKDTACRFPALHVHDLANAVEGRSGAFLAHDIEQLREQKRSREVHAGRLKIASLAEGKAPIGDIEKVVEEVSALDGESLLQRMERRRLSPDRLPPQRRVVARFANAPILSNGNLLLLTGQMKAGKTGLLTGMLAAAITGDEHMGWEFPAPEGAILHIDTEQTEADHHEKIGQTILRRTKLDRIPENFYSYAARGETPADIMRLVEAKVAEASRVHGRVLMVFIDVVEDLLDEGVNDIPSSRRVVRWLMRLADRYDCIVGVTLHENPDRGNHDSNQKPTGHTGTMLVKKAECVLKTAKKPVGEEEVFSAWTTHARGEGVPPHNAFRFCFSPDDQMHMPAGSLHLEYADEEKARRGLEAVLENPGITRNQLKNKIGGNSRQREEAINWLIDRGQIYLSREGQSHRFYATKPTELSATGTAL